MPEASEGELRRTMTAVVFGAIMSMLDTTIVNIAIRTLTVRLHTDLESVQWVVTGYFLALAGTLPLAGWLGDRFGPRRVYVWSIAVFTLTSVACGLSQSVGELIGFRVLQGIAGALTMPAGQMILVRVAGRARMARVMGTLSIPIIMAPVFGPVIGGLLLEHAGWRWIFFVNLPFGLVAVPVALWLLPRDVPGPWHLPDLLGLALISGGCVAVTCGLASVGSATVRVVAPLVGGVVLLAFFVVRSLRTSRPLLDVRLFRNAAYSASSLVNFALGGAVFGAMILMPLYYQSIRGQDPVITGLLVAPTGIGAVIATRFASRLTDTIGSGRTALAGGLVAAVGTVPFMFLGAATPYWWLAVSMLVRGIGVSLCMIPAMTASYRAIPPQKISDGTTQLNVVNRLGGSTGTAVFTVALQHALASSRGIAVAAAGAAGAAAGGAAAYGVAFRWAFGAAALALLPALVLTLAERRSPAAAASGAAPAASGPAPAPPPVRATGRANGRP